MTHCHFTQICSMGSISKNLDYPHLQVQVVTEGISKTPKGHPLVGFWKSCCGGRGS